MKTITVSIPKGYEPHAITSSKTEVIIICEEIQKRVVVKGFGIPHNTTKK